MALRLWCLVIASILVLPGWHAAPDAAPQTTAFPEDPRDSLLLAARVAGLDPEEVVRLATAPDPSTDFAAAYGELLARLGLAGVAPAALPPGVAEALVPLLDAMRHALGLRAAAVGELSPADDARLASLDAAHRGSRATGDRYLLDAAWRTQGLPLALDRTRLAAAAYVLLDAALDAAPALRAATDEWPTTPLGAGLCIDDGIGVLIVCGPFDDTLGGVHMLEIDLAGNDVHATNAGASGIGILWPTAQTLPAALALDLAGHDVYSGAGQVQATGSSTPGVLVDLEGDDAYHSGKGGFNFAQGAGNLGGVGFLYDALGSDWYEVPNGVNGDVGWDAQGFGILGGIGVLHDTLGNDVYVGGAMAQGVGDFNAFGALLDGEGQDHHEARFYSQGFGDGAGAGLLWDANGDDAYYLAEAIGQGAAVGGEGVLLESSGYDLYVSFGGAAQGWGAEGPAWKPVNDVLSALGVRVPGAGVVVDVEGRDAWHGSVGCDLCVWMQGTGTGVDSF